MAVRRKNAFARLLEAVSASGFAQTLRGSGDTKYHAQEAGTLNPTAAFARKYGILKKSAKAKPAAKRVDSDYGFPLPPKAHPKAVRYAHAVLSRAHQAKDYDAADVQKQVRKANTIVYGSPNPSAKQKADHKKKAEAREAERQSRRQLREYLPITPAGSWERERDDVEQAAKICPSFGGSVPGAGSPYGSSSWSISIWASFPRKRVVVIANTDTGKLWLARYEIDADGTVTFPTVKPAKQAIAVAEALKRNGQRLAERRK